MTTPGPLPVPLPELDSRRLQKSSDAILGVLLLIAGAVTLWDFPNFIIPTQQADDASFGPAMVGRLLVGLGVCLLIRAAFVAPAPTRRWGGPALVGFVALIVMYLLVLRTWAEQRFMLLLGPAEFVAILVGQAAFALLLARRSRLRAAGMIALGLLLGMVGPDLATGRLRLTFGFEPLNDGIDYPFLFLAVFVVCDGLICLAAPSVLLSLYARQIAGWAAPRLALLVDIVMRLVAALAIAAALYYVYALDNRPSDIVLAVGLALFGVACRFLDWNRLLLVLACSQGVLIEENIRRSLMISRGDVTIFLARPITGGLLLVAAALVAIATIDSVMSRRRAPGQ